MQEPADPDTAAPSEVAALATARARARASSDWTTADHLRERIEAVGWRIEDDGLDYTLRPLRQPDIVEDGVLFYGSLEAVPSVLDEPATMAVSIIVVVREPSTKAEAMLEALNTLRRPGMQVLAVAARGTSAGGQWADPSCDEVVRTVEPFAPGVAIEAALRRARGRVIVVLDQDRIPEGDVITPLVEGLADESVAIVGAEGTVSADLRHFGPGGPGDVTAMLGGCYAFRRADSIDRGPLDARLRLADGVAVWWSLQLRDEGVGKVPRRALAIDLPLAPRLAAGDPELPATEPDPEQVRHARRDGYRISDRFAGRHDLAKAEQDVAGLPGDGTGEHDQGDDADEESDAT